MDLCWASVFLLLCWGFAYLTTSTTIGFSVECVFFVALYAGSSKIAVALSKLVTHLILPRYATASPRSRSQLQLLRCRRSR